MRAFHHTLSWLGVVALCACASPSTSLPNPAQPQELAEDLTVSADDEPAPGPLHATAAVWPKKLSSRLVTLPIEDAELPACGRLRIERELAPCINALVHRHANEDEHLILEITAVSSLRRFEITEPIFIYARKHVTLRGRRVDGRLITLAASPELRRPPVQLETVAERSFLERWVAGGGKAPAPSPDRAFMFNVVDSNDVHFVDLRLEGSGVDGLHALGVCPTNERRVSHVSLERSLVRGFRGTAIVLGRTFEDKGAIDAIGAGLGQSRLRAYAARRATEKVEVTCSGFVSQVELVDNTMRLAAPAFEVQTAAKTPARVDVDPLDWTQTPDPLARDNHSIVVRNNRFLLSARAEVDHVLGLANVERVTVIKNVFQGDGASVTPVQTRAGVERVALVSNQVLGPGVALTQARVVASDVH
jgi:hypothetical protein